MKNRSELREIIIKVIYQTYILKNTNLKYDIDKLIKDQLEVENEYVTTCVNGIIDNRTKIDSLANKYLKDWTIDRLNNVDKSILSLGIYELMYTDTPSIVCINEAVELSKKYSEEKVTKMINGVLDNIYHSEFEDER
ncbi:MAG: transcription antitermination factor NusB [Bacilli bacterium]|nr:transcription antitermination factor NusB [Bacilli bacterium]